jgi:hypothetical protein
MVFHIEVSLFQRSVLTRLLQTRRSLALMTANAAGARAETAVGANAQTANGVNPSDSGQPGGAGGPAGRCLCRQWRDFSSEWRHGDWPKWQQCREAGPGWPARVCPLS